MCGFRMAYHAHASRYERVRANMLLLLVNIPCRRYKWLGVGWFA